MKISESLTGSNIMLRPLSENEVSDNYVRWLADPQINQFMEARHQVWTIDSIKKYVDDINSSDHSLILGIFTNDNIHIGNVKLGPIDSFHRVAYLSLFIGEKEYWGKGIATQAIRLMSEHGFSQCNLHKISAGMYMKNIGSLSAFLKAGFALEGVFKSHSVVKDQERTDVLLVGLPRDKFIISK